MDKTRDTDYILCECPIEALVSLTESLESEYPIAMVMEPSLCLTLLSAEDSVDAQGFYLGEALATECEVELGGSLGHGICLGEEPQRAYCLAVVDAVIAHKGGRTPEMEVFLAEEGRRLEMAEKEEFNQILRTKVDFKLFDQE